MQNELRTASSKERANPHKYRDAVSAVAKHKRRQARLVENPLQKPFVRAPGKTGQPAIMKEIVAQRAMKMALSKIETIDLIDGLRIPESALSKLVMLYPFVWQLSQGSRDDMLDIPGIGPATLKKIHATLTARRVPVRWSAE
jgi:hypothetical protein